MSIGYVFKSKSCNHGVFFDGGEPAGVLCPVCGTCKDYNYAPGYIDIHPSKRYDVSYTHDLRLLFSSRFVDFCLDYSFVEDRFYPVKTSGSDLYYMIPSRVLEFDVERRKTAFNSLCGVCGGYESIVGARPAFLKKGEVIGQGFYRSDVAFASGKSKFPLFFIGEDWRNSLASEKFSGIDFDEISD